MSLLGTILAIILILALLGGLGPVGGGPGYGYGAWGFGIPGLLLLVVLILALTGRL
jgi:hypothetical protein